MKLSNAISLPLTLSIALLGAILYYATNLTLPDEIQKIQEDWSNVLIESLAETLALNTINENSLTAQTTLNDITRNNELIGYAYISGFNQEIFAHTFTNGFPEELLNIPKTAKQNIINTDNEAYIHISRPLIEGMDAKLHIGIRHARTDSLTQSVINNISGIVFPFILFIAILAIFLSKKVSSPITNLTHKISEYTSGKDEIKFDTNTKISEVTLLGKTLDSMIVEKTIINNALLQAHDNLEIKIEERTKELAEANTKLTELDELKSMFIASMSHELRTPLNSIIGFSSVLLSGMTGSLTDQQRDQLERVSGSAKHLLDLISDIIDISKVEAGHVELLVEEFPVSEIVSDAVFSFGNQLKSSNIKLNLELQDELTVTTDRRRLLQVIINLLSNALKYSEKGSISIKTYSHNGKLILSIEDTGLGIAEENIQRLFEPFERIDNKLSVKAGGTGLGLYLTKKIVTDSLKGNISVVSELNHGSTFTVSLPLRIPSQTKQNSLERHHETESADY